MSWAQSFSRCWTDKWYEREAKLKGFLEEKHTASDHPHYWIYIRVHLYVHIPCEIFAIRRIGRLEHISTAKEMIRKNGRHFYCNYVRVDSRSAPSQWETSLPSNSVSHRLGAKLESTLIYDGDISRPSRCHQKRLPYHYIRCVSLQMFCFILPIGLLYSLYLYIYDQHLLLMMSDIEINHCGMILPVW